MSSNNVFMKHPKQDEADDAVTTGGGATTKVTTTGGETTTTTNGDTTTGSTAAGETTPETPAGTETTQVEETPAEKEKKGLEKRMHELTEGRKKAEREAQETKKQLSQALAAVERLTGKPAEETRQQIEEEDQEPQAPAFENPEQYQAAMATYTKELSGWTSRIAVKTALAKEQEKRANETRAETTRRVQETWSKRREEATKRLPDYAEVAENPELPISEAMASAITVDPEGADVAYYLGQNVAEAKRIAELPPGQQLVEFGVIKASLKAKRTTTQTTQAKPPIKPQGGGATTTTPLAEKSMEDYAAERNAKIAAEKRPGRT